MLTPSRANTHWSLSPEQRPKCRIPVWDYRSETRATSPRCPDWNPIPPLQCGRISSSRQSRHPSDPTSRAGAMDYPLREADDSAQKFPWICVALPTTGGRLWPDATAPSSSKHGRDPCDGPTGRWSTGWPQTRTDNTSDPQKKENDCLSKFNKRETLKIQDTDQSDLWRDWKWDTAEYCTYIVHTKAPFQDSGGGGGEKNCLNTVLSRGVRSLFRPTRKSSPWGNFSDGGLNQAIKRRLPLKTFGLIDWLTIS